MFHQFHLPKMILLLIALFFLITKIEAQSPNDQANFTTPAAGANFQPSLSIVIGILSLLFSITFILLVYAKFCHRGRGDPDNPTFLARSWSTRFSGIDKAVIESLPFFRFSSLRGSRQGLECAVCLSRFEDVEILRMLPKCKHAFHIDCIDHWLEKHSSCPLCRMKVSADDPALFTYSSSMRMADSGAGDGPSFEVFIEREESSRFRGFGSSFRRIFRGNNNNSDANSNSVRRNEGDKREKGEIQEEEESELHRFNHRIVVSDMMIKRRWSNLTPSDVMFLSKEMTNSSIGIQFSNLQSEGEQDEIVPADENSGVTKIKEEMERKRMFDSRLSLINKTSLVPNPGTVSSSSRAEEHNVCGHESKVVSPADRRVVSEITSVSRFAEPGPEKTGDARDERMQRLWLPIASRTVHWFANRERRPPDDRVTN